MSERSVDIPPFFRTILVYSRRQVAARGISGSFEVAGWA